MAGSKYDALRPEFVRGKMTLRQLAKEHGVSYGGLRNAAATGNWSGQRDKSAQNVTTQAEKKAVDRCAEWQPLYPAGIHLGKADMNVTFISFSWVPKSIQMVTLAMKLKDACSLEEKP